jgi:hypothetical protein
LRIALVLEPFANCMAFALPNHCGAATTMIALVEPPPVRGARVVPTAETEGGYYFTCKITARNGDSIISSGSVDVVESAVKLVGSPAGAVIDVHKKLACSAVAYDQFGRPMQTQPAFTYGLKTGAGSINARTGVYSAYGVPGAILIRITDENLVTYLKGTVVV